MSKEAIKLARVLEALVPFEKLFMQTDEKDMLGGQNIDCQIATTDLRKLAYAAADLREALAEQPAQQQEPVAWIEHEWSGTGLRHLHFEKREPAVRDEVVNPVWTPLYTSPPAHRSPLTDEQIVKCWGQVSGTRYGYVAFARAIEAAHGITKGGAA